MKPDLFDGIMAAGWVCAAYGVSTWNLGAGLVVLGAGMVLGGLLGSMRKAKAEADKQAAKGTEA